MTNRIELRGCAPEPLMHYLKALGVMRLVAEQLDSNVRGTWQGDTFVLESVCSKEELIDFFLNRYNPTPIVAPWNNGSGFHSETSGEGKKVVHFRNIRNSVNYRLLRYRETIEKADVLLKECLTPKVLALDSKKRSEALKPVLIPLCRNHLPDDVVQWFDAAALLTSSDEIRFPPLLGSAGNDGNLEFSLTFMGCLHEILSTEDKPRPQSESQLKSALFRSEAANLVRFSPGQFQPSGGGGVNAATQVKASELANPWDFVLAVEGILLFAGSAVRRMIAGARAEASFPFCVESSDIGTITSPREDGRGELFLPIWERATSYAELAHLFNEGRVRLKQRKIVDSLHFVRAIAELGVDRGITKFYRHRFLTRNGKMQFAVSLGSIEVPRRPLTASDLIREFDIWLEVLRLATRDMRKTPPRFARAVKSVDEAVFALCSSGGAESLREVLVALGEAEAELARGKKFREEHNLKPSPALSSRWARECHDQSAEFEIALALASISAEGDLLRANLEPIEIGERQAGWKKNDASVAWGAGTLTENLAAVLQRRSIDARAAGHAYPQLASKRFASLQAIDAFLRGETDEAQIEKLLWGLSLIDWNRAGAQPFSPGASVSPAPALSRAYALLKLLFLPDGNLQRKEDSEPVVIRHEPAIVPLLRAGRAGDALEIAERRLRASGCMPLTTRFHVAEEDGNRLAAALLIPVDKHAVRLLAELVLRPTANV